MLIYLYSSYSYKIGYSLKFSIDFMSGIDFVICGLEHTGTTIVSELFRQIPNCDSGFECGVLLAKDTLSFKNMEPFYTNFLKGWGLNIECLNKACGLNNFKEFYDYIYMNSSLFENLPTVRFDKTPRYVCNLENIYNKVLVPIIVCCKSIESIAWSDYKRSKFFKNIAIDDFLDYYVKPKKQYLQSALKGYQFAELSKSCRITHLEDLCFNAYKESFEIFKHCNQSFKVEYFVLKDKRFKNARGKSIDISVSSEHLVNAPRNFNDKVQKEFKEIIELWPKPRYLQNQS